VRQRDIADASESVGELLATADAAMHAHKRASR
jgi:hypothetical protein